MGGWEFVEEKVNVVVVREGGEEGRLAKLGTVQLGRPDWRTVDQLVWCGVMACGVVWCSGVACGWCGVWHGVV